MTEDQSEPIFTVQVLREGSGLVVRVTAEMDSDAEAGKLAALVSESLKHFAISVAAQEN